RFIDLIIVLDDRRQPLQHDRRRDREERQRDDHCHVRRQRYLLPPACRRIIGHAYLGGWIIDPGARPWAYSRRRHCTRPAPFARAPGVPTSLPFELGPGVSLSSGTNRRPVQSHKRRAKLGAISTIGSVDRSSCLGGNRDRKSTRLNSSHVKISY